MSSLLVNSGSLVPEEQAMLDLHPFFAVLDVGSNSFHMVIAKRIGENFQIVKKSKHQVQLAAGLDAELNLDQAAFTRAYQCLDDFSGHLEGIIPENIKAVGTHALRVANNTHEFLKGALDHFPVPIRVISGLEEAHLIYQGVVNFSEIYHQVLVIDIGGGSTEFAIGKGRLEQQVHSVQVGCVNLTKKHFADGEISSARFIEIEQEVTQAIEPFRNACLKTGWELCLGSSGSVKSIMRILKKGGFQKRGITLEHLLKIKEQILAFNLLSDIKLPGLQENRAEILPAATAMLIAIFRSLNIECIDYSPGTLKEGLLYDTVHTVQPAT